MKTKKAMMAYLKKVQRVQQSLLGKATLYVDIFLHHYEDNSEIYTFSVSYHQKSGDFKLANFYDYETVETYEKTFQGLLSAMREDGHEV